MSRPAAIAGAVAKAARWRGRTAIALLLVVALAGCATLGMMESIESLLAQGKELFQSGKYAEAREESSRAELARIAEAARLAAEQELEVLAGHGLNYTNVIAIAGIPEIVELNIGHSIVARAALVGMDRAVRDMVTLL